MNKIVLPRARSGALQAGDRYIFSSRVRVARNVDALPFPAHLSLSQKSQLEKSLTGVVQSACGSEASRFSLSKLSPEEVRNAEADLLITGAFSQYGDVFFAQKQGGWVLLPNEKDHLRLFTIQYGSALLPMHERLSEVLSSLEPHIHFAFHPSFGYLTAYADDAGTALSLCYLINLTAIEMTDGLDSLAAACEETGYRLTPYTGVRGSQLFFLKNLGSYGLNEAGLIAHFTDFTQKVLDQEQAARDKLFTSKEDMDFLNAQLLDAARAPRLSYHSMVESVALADMLYAAAPRDEWRSLIFTLHPHGALFNGLSSKEDIESLRADVFRKAYKKYAK